MPLPTTTYRQCSLTLTRPELRSRVALLAFATLNCSVLLAVVVARAYNFPLATQQDVIGWAAQNHYPIHLEPVFFLLALTSIPVIGSALLATWLLSALLMSSRLGTDIAISASSSALPFAWSAAVWPSLLLADPTWILTTAIIGAIATAIASVWCLARRTPFPANTPPPPASPALPPANSGSVRLAALCLLPILAYLATINPPVAGSIDMLHHGEQLAPLSELAHGKIPFRDIYIQHGLFFNAYTAFLAELMADGTLADVRLVNSLVEPLGYAALAILAAVLFRQPLLTGLLLLLIATADGNWISPRQAFGLLALAAAVHALRAGHLDALQRLPPRFPSQSGSARRGALLLLLAGFCTGLAFWNSTDNGIFTFAALTLFLACIAVFRPAVPPVGRLLPLASFFIGTMLGFWSFGWYFYAQGALGDVWENTYIQIAYHSDTWSLPYPSLKDVLRRLTRFSLPEDFRLIPQVINGEYYWPILGFMAVSTFLWYRFIIRRFWLSRDCLLILLVLISAVFSFYTALGRTSPLHLAYGSVLIYPLLLLILETALYKAVRRVAARSDGRARFRETIFVLAWIGVPATLMALALEDRHHVLANAERRWTRILQGWPAVPSSTNSLPAGGAVALLDERHILIPSGAVINIRDRLGTAAVNPDQMRRLAPVIRYIVTHTRPTDTIYDFSNQPGLYFLADRQSATRFFMTAYASPPHLQEEVIADLERQRTPLVILRTGGPRDAIDGIPNELRHPLIFEYLGRHYHRAIEINRTVILERNPT